MMCWQKSLDLFVTKYLKFSIIALWTFYFKTFHSAQDGKIRLVSAVCWYCIFFSLSSRLKTYKVYPSSLLSVHAYQRCGVLCTGFWGVIQNTELFSAHVSVELKVFSVYLRKWTDHLTCDNDICGGSSAHAHCPWISTPASPSLFFFYKMSQRCDTYSSLFDFSASP